MGDSARIATTTAVCVQKLRVILRHHVRSEVESDCETEAGIDGPSDPGLEG